MLDITRKIMEPIETNYVREQALHLAVQFIQSRPRYNVNETIEIAERFLSWLINMEENNA